MKSGVRLEDLRGLTRLVIEQAVLMTVLIEELHSAITKPIGLVQTSSPALTHGIAGLVYRSIHGSYHLVGTGVDAVLGQLSPLFDAPPSTPEREAMLAVLNGLWGDHLAERNNPLAIDLAL